VEANPIPVMAPPLSWWTHFPSLPHHYPHCVRSLQQSLIKHKFKHRISIIMSLIKHKFKHRISIIISLRFYIQQNNNSWFNKIQNEQHDINNILNNIYNIVK
jgi:hypothetical protein